MYQRILVPTDGSECSNVALDHALDLAKVTGASVTILHVIDHHYLPTSDPGIARQHETDNAQQEHYATQVLNRALDVARGRGVEAEAVWENEDNPQDAILDLAEAHDLIVIGSHGRSGLGRIVFGSVSRDVAGKATRPVLVIPCSA